MILWGPPGTGKTTLARMIAKASDAQFLALSAVMAGVKDIRAAVEQAHAARAADGRPTMLFLDEVHRFNKAQQDTFLPFLEDGTLTFIGATTENPSFEVVSARSCRARGSTCCAPCGRGPRRICCSSALADEERGLGHGAPAARAGRAGAHGASGRWRCAARAQHAGTGGRSRRRRRRCAYHRPSRMPRKWPAARGGASTRAAISSTTRSRRCTRPCAAPIRMPRSTGSAACSTAAAIRSTSRGASCAWPYEDIGLADPRAFALTLDAWEAYDRLGSPEGELALANAVVYLAVRARRAMPSTSRWARRMADVEKFGTLDVPLHASAMRRRA